MPNTSELVILRTLATSDANDPVQRDRFARIIRRYTGVTAIDATLLMIAEAVAFAQSTPGETVPVAAEVDPKNWTRKESFLEEDGA